MRCIRGLTILALVLGVCGDTEASIRFATGGSLATVVDPGGGSATWAAVNAPTTVWTAGVGSTGRRGDYGLTAISEETWNTAAYIADGNPSTALMTTARQEFRLNFVIVGDPGQGELFNILAFCGHDQPQSLPFAPTDQNHGSTAKEAMALILTATVPETLLSITGSQRGAVKEQTFDIRYLTAIPEPANLVIWLTLGAIGITTTWLRRRDTAYCVIDGPQRSPSRPG